MGGGVPPPRGFQSAAHRRCATACWTNMLQLQNLSTKDLSTRSSENFELPLSIISPREPGDHRSPAPNLRFLRLVRLLGSIFCPSETRFKNDFEKTSKKMRKSMIWTSQNLPQTLPKRLQNRRSPKTAIFRCFLTTNLHSPFRGCLDNVHFP